MGNHSTKPPPSGEPTLIYVAPAARQARESGETSIDSNVEVQGASVFHPAAERFRVGDLLGEGGTSRVFAAFDGDLEREIAIKVVPVGSGWSERQFIREARVTSSLVHPNVLPVYDVGRVEDG